MSRETTGTEVEVKDKKEIKGGPLHDNLRNRPRETKEEGPKRCLSGGTLHRVVEARVLGD